MTTAIDTNVIVALWDSDPSVYLVARSSLEAALSRGGLVISAVVFAELLAFQGRTEGFLDTFLEDTSITVDWNLEEGVWRLAGQAFQAYAVRRRKQRAPGPRRILPDFLIGAHAFERGYALLTYDRGTYSAAFPDLKIISASV